VTISNQPIDTRTFTGKIRDFISLPKHKQPKLSPPALCKPQFLTQQPRQPIAALPMSWLWTMKSKPLLIKGPLEARGFALPRLKRSRSVSGHRRATSRRHPAGPHDAGMDGFEVCRGLKKNSRTAHIPVLLITALPIAGSALWD